MSSTWIQPNDEKALKNAFSVDVEDYFQVGAFERVLSREEWDSYEPRVERNTLMLAEVLERFQIKGTFFFLGWVAERWPNVVKELHAAGHEIGVHGFDHRRVTTQTPEEFRHDVRRTKTEIESLIGEEVLGYRAPNYSVVQETLWALDILVEEGFCYDSSIFPIAHDRYGIRKAPRFPWVVRESNGNRLLEFPISTVQLAGVRLPFVGGGYLRQFPFWFARWGMRRVNRIDRKPVVVYIHPWEIDPDQPRVPVGVLTRLRHYRNLSKTQVRLERLFEEFRFSTIRDVLGL